MRFATVHLLLAVAVAAVLASPAGADENRMCLMCHGKEGLTGTRGGVEVPMTVHREAYAGSVHGGISCISCHADVDPEDLPHEDELGPATCSACHDEEVTKHAESRHGQFAAQDEKLAPTCATCHGTHAIQSHLVRGAPTSALQIPVLCGRCHKEGSEVSLRPDISQDHILENYSQSIHGKGLFRSGLNRTAVCTSCHTSHWILPHTDPRSSINRDNVAETCIQCHELIVDVHPKVIEGKKWQDEPDRIPSCVDCHPPHKPQQEAGLNTLIDRCLNCHGRTDLTMDRDGATVSLYVDKTRYMSSAHGVENVPCAQCHIEIDPRVERECETITSKVDCSNCHEEQVADYRISTHGTLHAEGDPDAPYCTDCHGKHDLVSHRLPHSPIWPQNVPELCGRCHRAGEKAATRIGSGDDHIVQSFVDSIHGKGLLKSGLTVTANCADCHSAHRELPPDDPRSTIHKDNVADTCGSCHFGIEKIFKTSIHWNEDPEKREGLPTCRDCHTSHTISRTDQPGFRFLMMEQCGRCHLEEAETFFDTFHGKVSRLEGGVAAAKCYDCHGTHDILPTHDVNSRLSRDNVVETCGQCHESSHRRFAGYLTHATHHDREKYPYLFWVFWIMTSLLVGTLSVAMLHTGAWLFRLARTRKEWKHVAVEGEGEQKLYRRFNRTQRSLHFVMLISFFTLALTGMSLKFSYMGWAQAIARVLGGFQGMGLLHRMGAVVLIGVFLFHVYDVARRKRRTDLTWLQFVFGPNSILFNRNDLKELFHSIKWFFGRGERPRYGRFTYWEKFDYFAVFWGVAVIGSTGMLLWFPELFTHIVPGWFINVATIIHSDEALLAVGFIFTVHFFNTHFRPDKFPMDPVIFTGRVPLSELKRDKPREYEELVASGELEEKLVKPFPAPAERAARIFGFVALGVGLILIGLIIATMVFGYR